MVELTEQYCVYCGERITQGASVYILDDEFFPERVVLTDEGGIFDSIDCANAYKVEMRI